MRFFKGRPLELLAPSGNFEIFKEVVQTKCDAIYFGGQSLNMRMIRKGFNFTNEEITEAIRIAHVNHKKVYITVNNLIDFDEIEIAKTYLTFLAQVKPDALIVQDFAIIELIRQLNLDLEVHASVMMNVHNLPMIDTLKAHQVTRVVLSREASLEEVKWIKTQTDMEIEYFTHGDMCIAHGAQCYYSSMLFGMSSNRGKCLKPCRWWFSTSADAENIQDSNNKSFPMAVKDLCLYAHLPEMIHAGVTAFKIEGRMREADFITKLINYYGDAMDRFIEDPIGYDRFKDLETIQTSRKRDLSTGYAFGKPGVSNINTRYEGTGKFYSTGKMFSTPTAEKSIAFSQIEQVKTRLSKTLSSEAILNNTPITNSPEISLSERPIPKISIRVNNVAQAESAIKAGVDRIYISGDIYEPDRPMSIETLKKLKSKAQTTEIYVGTPRMMNEMQLDHYEVWLSKLAPHMDGILIGNLGALSKFKSLGLQIVGDYSLNIFNSLAADFYRHHGLSQFMPSVELTAIDLKPLLDSNHNLELPVLGRLVAMYFEHDFHNALNSDVMGKLTLHNEAGAYDLYRDQHQRTHLLTQKSLSLLPVLTEILSYSSVKMLRIEAQTMTTEQIEENIKCVKDFLSAHQKGEAFNHSRHPFEAYTFGALPFDK
ncbi:U32 family peptidase [Fusibacter ferrireducens]|uniref:U32 family peptidase n=1 Tax=Fusibacter ferrireducens TaxID=2785058 RepID=A0ABR9ZNL4_9FIRM|nr:U32 family peptidase [Fusibacter ferrireducens]MBF4691911.1 U32 family peptidase [Fusibacter ferrireducens]